MLDRSRARRALSAAFAVACLLSLPTAAGAADPPATRPVPADAPTVATTPSGNAAIAWVVGGRTCVVLHPAGEPRPATLRDGRANRRPSVTDEPNGTCVTTPVLSQFHVDYVWSLQRDRTHQVLVGVAGPSVARVEARRAGAALASSPAAPAALPGPAAALRFWALEPPTEAGQAPDELAVLDASGAVRRAVPSDDFGTWGSFAVDLTDASVAAGTLLRRGRAGRASWQLRRTVEQKLAPTPLQPERRIEVRCLALSIKDTGGSGDTGQGYESADRGPCDDDDELALRSLTVEQSSGCATGTVLTVLARPPVRSLVAVLADGRRVTIASSALGGASGARGGALVVAPTVGIRRIEGLGAGGKAVRTRSIATAPLQSNCSGSTSFITESLFSAVDDLGAAPHTVQAVDSGAKLCLAVDRAPVVPLDCAVPPLDPETAWVGAADVPGGQYAYGLVPVEVAAARLTFTDGSTQTVAATPIPGYTGQYASAIAQIALDIPAPRVARSVALLDATGRVLGPTRTVGPYAFEVGRPVTLRPAAGGLPALRATPASVTFGRDSARITCVGFTTPRSLTDPCDLVLARGELGEQTITVVARCAPRRMVVLAGLRRSGDRLVIRLRGGREVVARSLRLPASAGDATGAHVALAVLGPNDAIASMRIRGKAARKLAIAYPAVGEQCGYSDQPGSAFS